MILHLPGDRFRYHTCPNPGRRLKHYLIKGTYFPVKLHLIYIEIRPLLVWLNKFKEGIFMSITLKQARIIAEASIAKGRELDLKPLSVVILDPRTSLVACNSEEGVSQIRWRIAQGKANAAIQLGMGSRALMVRAEQQAYFIQSMNGLAGGEFVPVPGGVLIRDADGILLGAVGISGDTSDNDEAAALAGISAAGLVAETG